VRASETPKGGDAHRKMYDFETLTYVPLDRRLIRLDLLSKAERDWIDSYHAQCRTKLIGKLSKDAENWLENATKAL
jgi:Xaa-Pro aminopeptidase